VLSQIFVGVRFGIADTFINHSKILTHTQSTDVNSC